MIPSISSKGTFTLEAPYNTLVSDTQELTVMSTRALEELQASGEDPLNNIYLPAGATEADFIADLAAVVPVVTFRTDSGDYIYVPANRVLSDAKRDGIKYVEKALIVNLGHLPANADMTLVTQQVTGAVYDTIGITPTVIATDTSAVISVTPAKDLELTTLRTNQKTVDKSYETRYAELLALYEAQQVLLANLDTVYIGLGKVA